MGDPVHITLHFEFNSSTKMNALAQLGAIINLIPFSLYLKLGIAKIEENEDDHPHGASLNYISLWNCKRLTGEGR